MAEKSSFTAAFEVEPARGRQNVIASFGVLGSANLVIPGFRASVERFGVGINIGFTNPTDGAVNVDDRNFNPVDLIKFEPVVQPVGRLAAEIELPPVTGGGYLEKIGDELRGAFAADLGVVSVSAFVVLDLAQFSMLAIMGAELLPPIQLSFGFTLVGVGGIVGINRFIDNDAISEAVASGDLSRVLFPRDPVGEAARILAVADRCFPYLEGSTLVGPIVKIGWGTPTMISATVAMIISTGDAKGTLIGRLVVALPAEALPLIYLETLFTGTFDQWGFQIDAELVNSRLTFMPVQGSLKLRLLAGPGEPEFAFSAGGFHPDAVIPEGMAGMKRLSADLSPSPAMKLRAEAYLAITPSSTQFGARIDMQIGTDGYGISGHMSADAWVRYDPFQFELSINASVAIECAHFDVAAVHLGGTIGGPNRWFIAGHASVDILGWDVDVDIPRTEFGPSRSDAKIVHREPLDVLLGAFEEPDNWIVTAPEAANVVRLVRTPVSADDRRHCHPLGQITFRQDNIPLNVEIQKVDGIDLDAPTTLNLLGGGEVQEVDFIPDRFFKLEDQLRRKSGYRRETGGQVIDPGQPNHGREQLCFGGYEIKVLQKEIFLPFLVTRPDFSGLIGAFHPEIQQPPILDPRDPGVSINPNIADKIFTDAAGNYLTDMPAWETEVMQ